MHGRYTKGLSVGSDFNHIYIERTLYLVRVVFTTGIRVDCVVRLPRPSSDSATCATLPDSAPLSPLVREGCEVEDLGDTRMLLLA